MVQLSGVGKTRKLPFAYFLRVHPLMALLLKSSIFTSSYFCLLVFLFVVNFFTPFSLKADSELLIRNTVNGRSVPLPRGRFLLPILIFLVLTFVHTTKLDTIVKV